MQDAGCRQNSYPLILRSVKTHLPVRKYLSGGEDGLSGLEIIHNPDTVTPSANNRRLSEVNTLQCCSEYQLIVCMPAYKNPS